MAGDLITIGTTALADAARAAEAAPPGRRREVSVDGSTVRLRTLDGATALPGLLRSLDAIGVNAVSAEVKRPTLDDVFLELTGRSLRDAGDIVAESIKPTESAQPLEVAS